ncbi:MAG: methylenetetrahydrofolate reductase [NAD(P)H] [Bacteroidia bacterium]
MKLIDILKNNQNKTLFSIEILPPLKGKGIQNIYNVIDQLLEFKPAFIDVTYHREEYVYKKRPGGYLEKVSVRKRPGTVGICAALMYKYDIETVPHMICGGFNKEETENALIDLNFLGIQNVLALRGDSIKSEPYFVPEPGGHAYAIDLVKQIAAMNKGIYLDEEMKDAEPTDFCIGVAGYPEKHFEAPNIHSDLMYLKQKIDAGAHYIVTQMFFDNKKYFDFVLKCKELGINVPIIPGIKILTSKKQLLTIPKIFNVEIPFDLYKEVQKCNSDEAVQQVGVEWCVQQCKELIQFHAPCLHFYTMGNPETTKKVAQQIF